MIGKNIEGVIVGAGIIINEKDLKASQDAGAQFGVSTSLLEVLISSDLPFLPGVATISEMKTLRDEGLLEQKTFPAEISGGVAFVKGIGG